MATRLTDFFIKAVFLVILILPLSLKAEDSKQSFSHNKEVWTQVTDSALATQRGGFILPNGIVVDISFGKRVFQNGVLTFSSYFETPESFVLVNDGNINLATDLNDLMLQSVVQNNLNDQTLTTINSINVDIKNLEQVNLSLSSSDFYTRHVLPSYAP